MYDYKHASEFVVPLSVTPYAKESCLVIAQALGGRDLDICREGNVSSGLRICRVKKANTCHE